MSENSRNFEFLIKPHCFYVMLRRGGGVAERAGLLNQFSG